jgi:hypothetical protein
MCCLSTTWVVGNLFVVGKAYLANTWKFANFFILNFFFMFCLEALGFVLLSETDMNWLALPSFIALKNWRLFMIMCALPSTLTAFTLTFLPESPKFYLYVIYSKQQQSF